MLNSYKKNSNKTIFYLVYSPPEQRAHNELELELELEFKLNVSDSSLRLVMNGCKIDVPFWSP